MSSPLIAGTPRSSANFLPNTNPPAEPAATPEKFQLGEARTLNQVSAATGQSVDDLRSANPKLKNTGADTVLVGDSINLPPARAADAPAPARTEPAPTERTPASAEEVASSRTTQAQKEQVARKQIEGVQPNREAPSMEQVRTPGSGAVLEKGMKGPAVDELHSKLHKLGYLPKQPPVFTSGSKDSTEEAVKRFQRDNGIQQNGKVGAQTLGALDEAVKTGYRAHVKVPTMRQPTSDTCDDTCEDMMKQVGTQAGKSNAEVRYLRGNDPERQAKGVDYMESQLRSGKPVMLGVDYKPGGPPSNDGRTDHFIVATGYGTDENGRKFISFNDPARGSGDKNNRLYYDPRTQHWTGKGDMGNYTLSAVVNNR